MECQLISIGSQLAPARQAGRQPASPAPTTNLQPKATSQLEARGWRLVAGDWWLGTGDWWLEIGGWGLETNGSDLEVQ